MKLEKLKDKSILIVGAAREGKATYDYLRYHFPDKKIDIVDQKDGPDYLRNSKNYDIIIKSPGIKPDVLKVPYTTAVNIFFANVPGMTIGVTGTKGKSTTASLIHAILKKAGLQSHLVGNIGNPMLKELLTVEKERGFNQQYWVCELSSYMTGDLQYSPHVSVILNLFPEHMDYHKSIASYYDAKKHIIAHATANDFFVYNPEVNKLVTLAKHTKAHVVPFIDKLSFDEKNIPLLGNHNIKNVKAAATVAHILQIPDQTIARAIQQFQPLRHRLQKIGTYNTITFYDDAISTTPESSISAIYTLENIGTIFLGGQDRGYDFSELVQVILDAKISNIVLFPDSGERILQDLRKRTKNLPHILQTNSTREAITFAYKYTKPYTICLLSPASPSYSLWKNFEERGDEFQREIKEQNKKLKIKSQKYR